MLTLLLKSSLITSQNHMPPITLIEPIVCMKSMLFCVIIILVFQLYCNSSFDAEKVGNIIFSLSRGKAAGLDCITAEHLQNCHPIISTLLAKLFNLMMRYNYVPRGFGLSYTVPIFLKLKTADQKL